MKTKRILTKIISLLVALTMIIPTFAFAAAADEPWDNSYNHNGTGMPFTPAEGYVSTQNPPDFKWGLVSDAASYELIVARDPELKDVVYNKAGLDLNYLSIDQTLETGIPLYWSVRYKSKAGNTSTWATVRKFRIDPDAYDYVVPDIDTIVANIPKGHPRAYVNPEDLDEFRTIKDNNSNAKLTYDYYMRTAEGYLKSYVIEKDPPVKTRKDFDTDAEWSKYFNTINGQCMGNAEKGIIMGYAYLLSGRKDFARYAIDLIYEYTNWDAINGLSSHKSQDQSNRRIMVYSALVYDWCYDQMTQEEREKIVEMILIRRDQVHHLLTSLDKSPYDSHGWTIYSMIGTVAYILTHDVPEAKDWLRKAVIGYTAFLPVWSYQDGGWCQGTGYARHSRPRFIQFGRVLYNGGVDLFSKGWMRNAYLYHIYTAPFDSVGSFGDEGGRDGAESNANIRKEYAEHIHFMPGDKNNGVRKWMMEQVGGLNTQLNSGYFASESYEAVEATPPYDYQLAHEFNDIGWINMTNDLTDTNRILFSFKSSPMGSFNHSHADNNGIFIEAFGEPVLAHSGYYDAYNTDHHRNICQATAAHNSITVDTKGQPTQDITAKGKLTGFLTQMDFDLAMGDATTAYKGALGKFERACIYVRPDMFVIVDDLKASGNKESRFEFWLNTPQKAEAYEEGNGARLTKGGAVLDATVHYPQKVNTYYNNIHAGSDMKEIIPLVKYTDSEVQKRIWFETERVNSTKMIVTLDPHSASDSMEYVDTEYFDEYVKMTFEDGSNVIVNITEDNRTITTKDGFTFDGLALAYNDESIMLVRGTTLKQGETDLVILEYPGSVVMGKDELSISTYTDNSRICVNTNTKYISKLDSVTDYDGRELTDAIGITYKKEKLVKVSDAVPATEKDAEIPAVFETKEDENFVTFTAWIDNYQLMLNGKRITTEQVTSEVVVSIDGNEEKVDLVGATKRDGRASVTAIKEIPGKKYRIDYISEGLVANVPAVGSVANVSKLRLSSETLEPKRIELFTVPITDVLSERYEDADAFQPTVTILKEAEDYVKDKSVGVNVYTSRKFLSGSAGVSKLDTDGMKAVYEIVIPEEGDYYFTAKYVAFSAEDSKRIFNIDGKDYVINLPVTAGYGATPEEWDVVKATVPIHLAAGTYELTLEPFINQWNYDWIGFVKK